MIIVQLKGGTGNQMFQYAAGRALALRTHSSLFLDLHFLEQGKLEADVDYRKYGLTSFRIQAKVIDSDNRDNFYRKALRNHAIKLSALNRLLLRYRLPLKKIYTEKKRSYNVDFKSLSRNTYLNGYWPSPKYFKDFEDIIRKDFRFKHEPDSTNREMITQISQHHESVAIHIRKGDFSKLDKLGVIKMDYYKRAIEYYLKHLKDPVFYLFGNDPNEVSKEINTTIDDLQCVSVDLNSEPQKHIEDLRLISHCKHQIIGNSTFAWWGAWLNRNPEKMVAAPIKIFNDKELNEEIQDMIPESWLRF